MRQGRKQHRYGITATMALLTLAIASSEAVAQTATDLRCANCVGPSDLASRSVTEPKLGNSAVTTDKIAAGAVTTNKLAAGSVSRSKIRAGAVATGKIANGAVTFEKLGPAPVTSDKLAVDAVFSNTVYVRGTDTPEQNCTALRDAIAAIDDAGASNPYVVKLEPGVYDCGTETLELKRWVSLSGSGQGVTRIVGSVDTLNGLVRLNEETHLSDLTIHNTAVANGNNVFAVRDASNSRIRLTRVTAIVDGNGNISIAISLNQGPKVVTESIAVAEAPTTAFAVQSGTGSDIVIDGASLSASASSARGLWAIGDHEVRITNSVIKGSTFSVLADNFSTVRVAGSELDGTVFIDTNGGATMTCVSSYDASFAALGADCATQ